MTTTGPTSDAVRRHRPTRSPGWAVLFVVVMAGQLYALYVPQVTVETPTTWFDKVVHPVIFLVPLVVGALWWGRWQPVTWVLVVHAPLSEVIQHYALPHRDGDVWDAVADLVGVAIGVVVASWLLRRRAVAAPGSGARP